MKIQKGFITILILFSATILTNAQELGIRAGAYSGNGGVAADAVFATSKFSRVHMDLSFGQGVGTDVLFDFLYRPVGGEAFNWYMGVGPYAYLPFDASGNIALGAVGEIGLLYAFNSIPFTLSVDWRPYFRLIQTTDIFYGGFGVNIRYVL